MPAYIFAVLICIYTVITMKTRCSFTKFKGLLLTFIFLFQWFALKQKNVRGEDCIVTQPWWSLHCRAMHWLIQPFAQTPLNQICRVFTLSFKTHSNTHTHTHAYTRRHTIFSAQRSCSVHRSKVDGHEWESTSVTGEVSERGLCFFGGEANVCNVAKRWRRLKKSISFTCAIWKGQGWCWSAFSLSTNPMMAHHCWPSQDFA